jgi:hypothetical protein
MIVRRSRSRRAAALISAIALLVAVGVLAACLLSVHATQVSTEEGGIQHLRASAAAMAATHLTLWTLSNEAAYQDAMARVVFEGDTSFETTPLFQITGDLAGATFNVDVWPGADTVRLKARGIAGGYYLDRWTQMPITLNADLRFGYDEILPNQQNNVRDKQIATQALLAQDATVTSISAYIKGPQPMRLRFAIYADAGGEPGALIAETAPDAVGSNTYHWHTIATPATFLSAGTYWLALSFENNGMFYRYAVGGGQTRVIDNDAVDNGFVNPWGASSTSNTRQVSIFGTYTPN